MASMLFGNQTSRKRCYYELPKPRNIGKRNPFIPQYSSILKDMIPETIEGQFKVHMGIMGEALDTSLEIHGRNSTCWFNPVASFNPWASNPLMM